MRRLPGTLPLPREEWLVVDDAYAPQMALRRRLMAERPGDILAEEAGSEAAVSELYEAAMAALAKRPDFAVGAGQVTCPDGVVVALDPQRPLVTLNALLQEDLCVMERRGDEHVLTAGLLAFPSSWTLAQKIGRPLTRIHAPVSPYDRDIARRVQRLFDGIRPDRPMWRANALIYDDPSLFQPRREDEPRDPARVEATPGPDRFLRSERQCLLRLPRTGAVIFSIHTWVVRLADLTEDQRAGLAAHPPHKSGHPA